MTIRRLLSHSAGLSVHGFDGFLPEQPLPSLEESLSGNNSSDHMDGGAGDVRIAMEPGAQFSYSGGGYTLLQLLVEEVTGETFTTGPICKANIPIPYGEQNVEKKECR